MSTWADRYRLLMRATNDAIWDWDLVTDEIEWNPGVSMFGYSLEQVTDGAAWWEDHIHPEDRQSVLSTIYGVINSTSEQWRAEYRFLKADGGWAEVLDRGYVLRDGGGRAVRMVGSMLDVTSERQTRRALQDQLRLTEAITNNASVALFIMDDRQECVFMNPAAEELTGFGMNEVRGRPLHDVIHHAHPDGTPYPLAECPIDRAFPERNKMVGEEVFIHKDGSFYTVEFTASPIRQDDQPIGTVIEVRNITAEKAAREELRQLASVVERSPDFIGVADLYGRPVYVNTAGRRLVGAEDLPASVLDFYRPEDRHRIRSAVLPAVIRKGAWSGELYLRHLATGEIIPAASDIFRVDDPATGAPLNFATVTRDLREARHSEAQFQTLAESIPQLCWMANAAGEIFWFNRRWYEYTGAPFEQPWESFLHPDEEERVQSEWRDHVASGDPFETVFSLRDAAGVYRTFLTRVQPLKGFDGRVIRWFGTNTDVHELRNTQEALRRSNEDLSQFAFAAAHDLQEPLRTIQTFTQLLARRLRDKLDDEDRQLMEFVVDGSSRMSELIRDLREFLDVTQRSRIPPRPVDLNDVLREVTAQLEAAIQESGATIAADKLPVLKGERVHFTQLLQNVISNAIKYRRADEPPVIRVGANRTPGEWTISVTDNGQGIPPEYRERIFGVFRRLHGREIPGTGIGLAICQKVVERYGGRMSVESEVGKGSTFRFTLPA